MILSQRYAEETISRFLCEHFKIPSNQESQWLPDSQRLDKGKCIAYTKFSSLTYNIDLFTVDSTWVIIMSSQTLEQDWIWTEVLSLLIL